MSHAIPRWPAGRGEGNHRHVVADEEAVRLFDRLRELNERYRLGVPAWRLGLEALARRWPPAEIDAWLHGLKVRNRDIEQIEGAIVQGPKIAEGLSRDSVTPADVVVLAEPRGRRRRRYAAWPSETAATPPPKSRRPPPSRQAPPPPRAARRREPPLAAPPTELAAARGARRAVVTVPTFRSGCPRLRGRLLDSTRRRQRGPVRVPQSRPQDGRRRLRTSMRTWRRLCAEIGADEEKLTVGFQTHSTVVNLSAGGLARGPG